MKEIVKGIFVETEYEGVNVSAVKFEDTLICVDAPSYPRDARQWISLLSRIHPKSPRYLFITDCHGDRMLNARWMHAPVVVQQKAAEQIGELKRRYPHDWIQSLIKRNSPAGRELSSGPVEPVALSFSDEFRLLVDGKTFIFQHAAGPMPSTSWLYIPERGILFTGDSVVVKTHPPIANMRITDWISSLERLMKMEEEIDVLVPGRGPLADLSAVPPIMDYLLKIRELVTDHIAAGMTSEGLDRYVDDLVECFPVGTLPLTWLQSEILLGLKQVYKELIGETYLDTSCLETA